MWAIYKISLDCLGTVRRFRRNKNSCFHPVWSRSHSKYVLCLLLRKKIIKLRNETLAQSASITISIFPCEKKMNFPKQFYITIFNH